MSSDHKDITSIRPWRTIERRKCRQIMVGKVPVGGDAPIAVQSMTNTVTHDVAATIAQVRELEIAGADIVRVSVPDPESAEAMKEICHEVNVPIVADIHLLRTARRVCALIPAILVDSTASKKSSPQQEIMVALSVLASMAGALKKSCSKNMASLAPTPWSRAR